MYTSPFYSSLKIFVLHTNHADQLRVNGLITKSANSAEVTAAAVSCLCLKSQSNIELMKTPVATRMHPNGAALLVTTVGLFKEREREREREREWERGREGGRERERQRETERH